MFVPSRRSLRARGIVFHDQDRANGQPHYPVAISTASVSEPAHGQPAHLRLAMRYHEIHKRRFQNVFLLFSKMDHRAYVS